MVGPLDLHVPEQIGIDLISWMTPAGIGLAVDGANPHAFHQGAHMSATDYMSFASEHIPKHPGSGKGIFKVQLIYPMH